MMNEFDKRYVEKILALHDEMQLERGNDPETRLWHALRSILEWCDAQHPRIDFDLLLEQVREDFNAGDAA